MISTPISVVASEPNAAGVVRHSIVARPPDREGQVVLYEHHDEELVRTVERSIRQGYAMGRKDSQRQTAAVLRSLLGDA